MKFWIKRVRIWYDIHEVQEYIRSQTPLQVFDVLLSRKAGEPH